MVLKRENHTFFCWTTAVQTMITMLTISWFKSIFFTLFYCRSSKLNQSFAIYVWLCVSWKFWPNAKIQLFWAQLLISYGPHRRLREKFVSITAKTRAREKEEKITSINVLFSRWLYRLISLVCDVCPCCAVRRFLPHFHYKTLPVFFVPKITINARL